jgi:thiosulfate reductase cytochrome b subunit
LICRAQWRFQSSLTAQVELKMRKLCADEVRGVKMKKNEKNKFCNLKKLIFFAVLFWLLHNSRMICRA